MQSQLKHHQTIFGARHDLAAFVGRVGRRHKENVVKLQRIARRFGQNEMPQMDGIERTAQQTDAICHGMLIRENEKPGGFKKSPPGAIQAPPGR
jgi:hypothetical protein